MMVIIFKEFFLKGFFCFYEEFFIVVSWMWKGLIDVKLFII